MITWIEINRIAL